MTSAHGEEQSQKMLEISSLKLDYASRVMHLNFADNGILFQSCMDLTLRAKGQTLNICPEHLAPNGLGFHSVLAHLFILHRGVYIDTYVYLLNTLLTEIQKPVT